MNNATLIKRLTQINEDAQNNFIKQLIAELKDEELAKGFKGSDKTRLTLARRLQNKMFNRGRPVLSLFHKINDEQYVWCDTAILVKVDKDFVENGGLHTTDKDWVEIHKLYGNEYTKWKANETAYPNVDSVWLTGKPNVKTIDIDVKRLMDFINANKEQNYIKLIADDDTTINFDRQLFYNAMLLSNAYKRERVVFSYVGTLKPIQIDDIAIITPIRYDGGENYVSLDLREENN